MPRFSGQDDGSRKTIAFDDGGMNLLSSEALLELGKQWPVDGSRWPVASGRLSMGLGASTEAIDANRESEELGSGDTPPRPQATGHRQPLLLFRSGRPDLFAAGADMNEMQRFSARDAEEFARRGQELFSAIERLPCVTVALIDGDCFGGALDLAFAFDLRFSTPRSRFSHPGSRLCIVTGF